MSNWTTPALERLEHYLELSRTRAAASGADADEVATDLRQHVENEVAALKLPVVTEEDVQRIIARLGTLPEAAMPVGPAPSIQGRPGRRVFGPIGSMSLLTFGVLLPLATLIIELATHMCAGTFFDPLPTWFHVLLVATVPGGNLAAWWWLREERTSLPRWLWWLNGTAVGAGIFYAILYLPMSPFAAIAILYLGFGLLPLSPLLSMICTLRFRSRLGRTTKAQGQSTPRGWWWASRLRP